MRVLRHHAQLRLSMQRQYLQRIIKVHGDTWCKSRTKAISPKQLKSRDACNHDAIIWMAVVCHHRVGLVCLSLKFSIQMTIVDQRRQAHRRHPFKTSKTINNIYRRELALHRPPMDRLINSN